MPPIRSKVLVALGGGPHELFLDRHYKMIVRKHHFEVFESHPDFDASQVSQRYFFGSEATLTFMPIHMLVIYDGEFVTISDPKVALRGAYSAGITDKVDLMKLTRMLHDRLKKAGLSFVEYELHDINGHPMNQCTFLNYANHPHKKKHSYVPVIAVVHSRPIRTFDFTLLNQMDIDKVDVRRCVRFEARDLTTFWDDLTHTFELHRENLVAFFRIDSSDSVQLINKVTFSTVCMNPDKSALFMVVQNKEVPWGEGLLHLKGFRPDQVALITDDEMHVIQPL